LSLSLGADQRMGRMKVFQCPGCQEYISADAKFCRFCSTLVDAEKAEEAADKQKDENKQYRRKQFLKHMKIGGSLLVVGAAILTFIYIQTGVFPLNESSIDLPLWGLTLSGAGDFLYGLAGLVGRFWE
jgi:hypothetical protein